MTSKEVMAVTGATPRQLQWLDENGIVPVRIEAHSRHYSRIDVELVKVWLRTRGAGLGYHASRRAVESARKILVSDKPAPAFMICGEEGDPITVKTAGEILTVFGLSTRPAVLVAL